MEALTLNDGLHLKGHVQLRVYDKDMNPILNDWQEFDNLITTNGFGELARVLIGDATISYCGVGSSDTEPTVTDTDLTTAIASRKPITESSRTGAICLFSTFYNTSSNNGDWKEAILATGSSGNNIISHALFTSTFEKTTEKQCYIDWTISLS
jgi:hypothetical protein